MRSNKTKREAEIAADVLHGKQLLTILTALRGNLAAKKAELARASHEGRKKSVAREIAQIQGLIELRKSELQAAIKAAEDEREHAPSA